MHAHTPFGWSLPLAPHPPLPSLWGLTVWSLLLCLWSISVHQFMLFIIFSRCVRSCETGNSFIKTETETSHNGYVERQMSQSVVSFFLGQQFFWVPISMPDSSLCVHASHDISDLVGGQMVVMQVRLSLVWSWASFSNPQLLSAGMLRRCQHLPSLNCVSSVFMAGALLSIPLCYRIPDGLGVVFWKYTNIFSTKS